jgi:hypothetical protein
MVAMVLPADRGPGNHTDALLQVSVHLQVTVMAPEAARHKANVWLSMNAGHLLLAEDPELVLNEPLRWRFDVVRSLPRRARLGTVQRNIVGRIHVDAVSGEIVNSETLVEELTASANSLADHAT